MMKVKCLMIFSNLNTGESLLSDNVFETNNLTYKGMEEVVQYMKEHRLKNFSELHFAYNGMDSIESKLGNNSIIKYVFEFTGGFNNDSIDETDLMIFCIDLLRA